MSTEVILPRVDMDMTEGAITAWHVKEGEPVKQGEPLFDIETSKATMEVEAPATGIVRRISAGVGVSVPVGTVIAWIDESGDAQSSHESANADSGKPRASPAARRVAREHRLELGDLRGSGPHGRIVADDVLAHLNQAAPRAAATARLNRIWLHDGDAATLVCLHGFAAEANSWRPLANALRDAGQARRVGVLSIDLPGHGKSPADDAFTLERIVAAVEAVLMAEGIDACHVVGHSFGGAIAMALSANTHAEVQSLTLIAPAGLGRECDWAFIHGLTQAADRVTLMPWLRELVHRPECIDDGFVASALQQVSSNQKRATLTAIARAFFADGRQQVDLRPVLAKLAMPVRVIWGMDDRIMPVAHAAALPGSVAQHRFPGVGHMPQIEAAADVARIVSEQIGVNRKDDTETKKSRPGARTPDERCAAS
jgi:pyruvate dehydrogenase E2 component (dihydrolipoamide acetyltransferase)